jgi:subtilisin family serine protease
MATSAARISSILVLAVTFVFSVEARADDNRTVKVFKDQYLVELHSSAAALHSDAQMIAQPLGPNTQLITLSSRAPETSMAVASQGSDSGTPEIVPYSADNDDCIHLMKRGEVKDCSPNFALSISDTIPNDPQFPSLWGMNASAGIDAPRAWDLTTGSSDVVVAVIDTGVDYSHPDLVQNMWVNPGEIAGDGIDNDNNGYVDDVHGMSAIGRTGDPRDDNGHGTHCAGTIAGRGNNGVGVAGVTWNSKIMALKFLSASGSGSQAGAVEAINYMVAMRQRGVNIRVSSNSWGGGGFSQILATAIRRAIDAGIVFVAAAGNESNNNDQNASYPAGYDGVVSVAAVDRNRNLASFSNYGQDSVDIAAPGVSILSTVHNGGYATLSGTSMATPHVSGAFALLFAASPDLSPGDAISKIYDSGIALASLSGVVRTGRLLNVGRALRGETAPVPPPTPTPVPCGYDSRTISFASDSALESSPIIAQGDEFVFKELNLPFSFPFSGNSVSSVTVSLNGVVYIGRSSQSLDYQNEDKAPLSSIAAFHSDLIMDGNLGVRAIIESNRVSIFWLAEHYFMRGRGQIMVRLVINQDGTIEDYVDFSNTTIEEFMRGRATIGVTGPNARFSTTFAYNNDKIRSGLGVQFVPNCSGQSTPDGAKVSAIRLSSSRGAGIVQPQGQFRVRLNASGSGVTQLGVALDGQQCNQLASVSFDGPRSMNLTAPRALEHFRSITIYASGEDETKGRAKIQSRRSTRNGKRSIGRARNAAFNTICQSIASRLGR